MNSGRMSITGQSMADEDGVRRIFVENAIGLVRDSDRPQFFTAGERQQMRRLEEIHILRLHDFVRSVV